MAELSLCIACPRADVRAATPFAGAAEAHPGCTSRRTNRWMPNQASAPEARAMITSGVHDMLAELFGVARSTVYRAVERERLRAAVGAGNTDG